MLMNELYSFLEFISSKSDFDAELSRKGGYITFSNSGRRGGAKFFQIGIENIIQTLQDILNHLDVFQDIAEYEEKAWRDNGAEYFTDPVANANSTVQTKPLFSTLSKIIIWANQPVWDKVNPDKLMALDRISLQTTINKLQMVSESFTPVSTLRMTTTNNFLQQIFYGAPGTGKSHIVKKQTEGESVVHTTFHPDSDYSTFVGCYKPTMGGGIKEIVSITELKKRLFEIKLKGEVYPCQKFGAQCWNSLIKLSQTDVKEILKDCGYTESMSAEIAKGISVGKEMYSNTEDRIVYEFVDQAFLQAYIKAWKFYAEAAEGAEPKKQYLIIEEINRGNCAQIFGDLFQLLDRNGCGFSDYYIHADKDIQKHLSKAFNNIDIDESHRNAINSLYPKDGDIVAKVLSGEILLLPNNLYIWATMNTSDQSLFPIDSAFKRRWDWRFRPIVKGRDNSGKELEWKIKIGQKVCAWWDFLEKINAVIGTMTSSADKKLGFFFCKAEDGIISAETFVSKVIFYLWNDVFKDYGFEGSIFSDSEGTLDFDKFYGIDVDGEVVVQNDKIELFLTNLGLTLVDVDSVNENINNEGEVAENDGTSFEVVLDGERISEKTAIGKFLKVIEKVGIERVAQLGLQVSGNPIISRDKLAEDTPGGYGGSQKYINGYWFVTKFNNPTKRKFLMEIKEKLGVNIVVE